MKKNVFIIEILLFLSFVVLLSGCRGTSEDETGKSKPQSTLSGTASLPQTESSLPEDTDTVTLGIKRIADGALEIKLTNHTAEPMSYSDDFYFERYNDANESWHALALVSEDIGFNDITYELEPGASAFWNANYDALYGKTLAPGSYRVVKKIISDGTGSFPVYGTFEIY